MIIGQESYKIKEGQKINVILQLEVLSIDYKKMQIEAKDLVTGKTNTYTFEFLQQLPNIFHIFVSEK